jgi:small conductance mechanosensitive channel
MMPTPVLGDADWSRLAMALAIATIVASVLGEVVARLTRVLLLGVLRLEAQHRTLSHSAPIIRRPINIVRGTVFLATLSALALPALDFAGVDTLTDTDARALGRWLLGSGLRIAVIGILAYLLIRIIAVASHRLEEDLSQMRTPDAAEQIKRARTLSGLVRKGLTAIVVTLAVLMGLRELQIDIMPILTGAGIAGLAVGFGAQTLVKDLIAGFFMTLENHIRVGDVARINGIGGLVEEINLRTVVLRDVEGVVHVFPNGSVTTLANLTKDFSYFLLDLGVSYKEDIDRVTTVLRAVGAAVMADPGFAGDILEPLQILGVEAFAESQVTIRLRIKTVPQRQWDVGRELRRRIKIAFDAHGIEIPFRQVSITVGGSTSFIPGDPGPAPQPDAP